MNVEQAYEFCTDLTRRAARNFYYGIRLLPKPKRRALCALYAWSRVSDDAVDEHTGAEAQRRLDEARSLVQRAFSPGYAAERHPIALALGDAVRRYRLPQEPFDGLLQAMEMDLTRREYGSFAELVRYCEHAAGTVGLLCVHVFGYSDPQALSRAVEMGIALQLTNILRDVKEDAERGRIYLPRDERLQAGVREEDIRLGRLSSGLRRVLHSLADRAFEYYERAEALFPLIADDARLCPMILHALYREILVEIQAAGYNVFRERIRLSTARKLQLVGTVLWRQHQVAARRV